MSIRADADDRYVEQNKATFNVETGTFSKPLSAVDEDQYMDFDENGLQADVADADIAFTGVNSSGVDASSGAELELDADAELDAELDADADAELVADADADSDQIFTEKDGESQNPEYDPVDAVLNDSDHFNKMVNKSAADVYANEQMAGGLNARAQQLVASNASVSGMIASGIANKIAARRENRNYKSFSNDMDSLNDLTQRILPKNFDPKDPNSVAAAKAWFKTDKGMADSKELASAYKKLLDSGMKIVKDHRSGSSDASSLGIQENILKKTAAYIKQHEDVLKTMKSGKDNTKSLHDDFKGGLGDLMDLAKVLMARLAVLLGMTKALSGQQGNPAAQAAAPKAPRMG